VLNAYGSHIARSRDKGIWHLCCTFVFWGDTKKEKKVQQRCQTPLSHDLAICEPSAFSAYGFHMPQFLPLVLIKLDSNLKCKNAAGKTFNKVVI
jgi:hypothetical protein